MGQKYYTGSCRIAPVAIVRGHESLACVPV